MLVANKSFFAVLKQVILSKTLTFTTLFLTVTTSSLQSFETGLKPDMFIFTPEPSLCNNLKLFTCRLTFSNLHEEMKRGNNVGRRERDQIWIPKLIFSNSLPGLFWTRIGPFKRNCIVKKIWSHLINISSHTGQLCTWFDKLEFVFFSFFPLKKN